MSGALTIEHTSGGGTLLHGTWKGCGINGELFRNAGCRGWKWSRNLGCWYIQHSRDRPPNHGLIDMSAAALRAAGFEVEVEVDAAPRSMAEAEQERREHMDDRAAALTAKAVRKVGESDAVYAVAQEIADGIPLGQPVLVGHHSERRHRRDLDKMNRAQRKSIELDAEAQHAEHGAETSARHMDHREDPRRTVRRIETLEADFRRAQRALDGHTRRFLRNDGTPWAIDEFPPAEGEHRTRLLERVAHIENQLVYWRSLVDQAVAEGRYNPIDPATINPGDMVSTGGTLTARWYEVVKVNRVTLSCDAGGTWRPKIRIADVRQHRPATAPATANDRNDATHPASEPSAGGTQQ